MVFAIEGLASGLGLGLILAALLEYRDKTLRTESDVFAFTKLPTLAVVSFITDLNLTRAAGKRRKFFSRKPKPIESALG
jgi:hypothetical protein